MHYSTPEQASGDSYRRQAELSSRYAEERGLNLDTALSLCDLRVSGFTGENRCKGALALFLKAVETGKVPAGSFLLVESLDRLSRDTMSEQMSLSIGLINAGLTVVTLADVQLISARTLKMLDQSARNLKKGVASPPIDLSQFPTDQGSPCLSKSGWVFPKCRTTGPTLRRAS